MGKNKINKSKLALYFLLVTIILIILFCVIRANTLKEKFVEVGTIDTNGVASSTYKDTTASFAVAKQEAVLYGSSSSITPGGDIIIEDPLDPKPPSFEGIIDNGEKDEGKYSDPGLSDFVGDTEFMIFDNQNFTEESTLMTFANPSINEDNGNYPIVFTVYDKDKSLEVPMFSTKLIYPSESIAVDMSTYLTEMKTYNLRIVSTPRKVIDEESGYYVNFTSLEQDITAKMSYSGSSVTVGEQVTGQRDGEVYSTIIYLDTNTFQASVILPRVIVINEGTAGSDVPAGYRFTCVSPNFTCTLFAGESMSSGSADNNTFLVASKNLDGDHNNLNTLSANISIDKVNSSVSSDKATTNGAHLYEIGPIHCTLQGNAVAKSDYYGATRFRVEAIKGV